MSSVHEPWLRGPLPRVHPCVKPVFYSFQQVRDDLARHVTLLSDDRIDAAAAAGQALRFHLAHLGGSVDRLSTYLIAGTLSREQLAALAAEQGNRRRLAELLAGIETALEQAEQRLQAVDPASLFLPREVGRQKLPTTVFGLLVHLAEHTQTPPGPNHYPCETRRNRHAFCLWNC